MCAVKSHERPRSKRILAEFAIGQSLFLWRLFLDRGYGAYFNALLSPHSAISAAAEMALIFRTSVITASMCARRHFVDDGAVLVRVVAFRRQR